MGLLESAVYTSAQKLTSGAKAPRHFTGFTTLVNLVPFPELRHPFAESAV